jgi:carbon-monoxide dehydrogenase medium subunit
MINSHPGLPEFDYVKPASLQEASRFLAEHSGEARPFSGGTDCFVRMRDGFMKPRYMVDVKGLEGTACWNTIQPLASTIGAAVPMNQVARCREAIEFISIAGRSRKLGGQLPVAFACFHYRQHLQRIACWRFDRRLSGDGRRIEHSRCGWNAQTTSGWFLFYRPRQDVLKPGDVVVSITIPQPPKGHGHSFVKLNRNKVGDLSIVAVTAYAYRTSEMASGYHFSVSLTSVAPTPLMVQSVTDLARRRSHHRRDAVGSRPGCHGCRHRRLTMCAVLPVIAKYMVRNLAHRALTEVWAQVK